MAFGFSEIIFIIIALVVIAIAIGSVIALIAFFSSRNKQAQLPPEAIALQQKLKENDSLRSQNLISEAEHEAKKKELLSGR